MNEFTHVSLFSGIGGIDLAAEWAGFKSVAFCERDPYCQKVLKLHWPDVPICDDIYEMGVEWLSERGLVSMAYTDNRGFPPSMGEAIPEGGTTEPHSQPCGRDRAGQDVSTAGGGTQDRPTHPITLISGGFPCQPFSVAGKRKGKEDDRYLWPEMFRVIQEVRPSWVLGENVAGFIRMGLDEALSDLEGLSYQTQAFSIPACAVDAPHRRERIFFVANSNGNRPDGWKIKMPGGLSEISGHGFSNCSKDVAHSDSIRWKKCTQYDIQPEESERKSR